MRHSTAHPLTWGEDERSREKCQLSSSMLQEHMWDRSSLTTPRRVPRSSRAPIQNRRMLPKSLETDNFKCHFCCGANGLLLLQCGLSSAAPRSLTSPSGRSQACLEKDTRGKADLSLAHTLAFPHLFGVEQQHTVRCWTPEGTVPSR